MGEVPRWLSNLIANTQSREEMAFAVATLRKDRIYSFNS
jgi:hypothetical protein